MASFAGVEFTLFLDSDMFLPFPVPDENGIQHYSASILLSSQTDYLTLLGKQSTVTELPALGGGGLLVVERGVGRKTLTIPLAGGVEVDYQAVLVGISAHARAFITTHLMADCDWTITEAASV